jgi:hypothetical protein
LSTHAASSTLALALLSAGFAALVM